MLTVYFLRRLQPWCRCRQLFSDCNLFFLSFPKFGVKPLLMYVFRLSDRRVPLLMVRLSSSGTKRWDTLRHPQGEGMETLLYYSSSPGRSVILFLCKPTVGGSTPDVIGCPTTSVSPVSGHLRPLWTTGLGRTTY